MFCQSTYVLRAAEGGRGADTDEEWGNPGSARLPQTGQSGEGAAETGSSRAGERPSSGPE